MITMLLNVFDGKRPIRFVVGLGKALRILLLHTVMYRQIRELVLAQQAADPAFIGRDVEKYLDKLFDKAEFIVHANKGQCQGFVAYYCNDYATLIAYITLILVTPACRNSGLGSWLVDCVIQQARKRGFTACQLEVHSDNENALSFYEKHGFRHIRDTGEKTRLMQLEF